MMHENILYYRQPRCLETGDQYCFPSHELKGSLGKRAAWAGRSGGCISRVSRPGWIGTLYFPGTSIRCPHAAQAGQADRDCVHEEASLSGHRLRCDGERGRSSWMRRGRRGGMECRLQVRHRTQLDVIKGRISAGPLRRRLPEGVQVGREHYCADVRHEAFKATSPQVFGNAYWSTCAVP